MPEIKAFTLVNATANPATEILVVDLTFATSVSLLNQLFDVIVIDFTKLAKDLPKFINGYKSIMILV